MICNKCNNYLVNSNGTYFECRQCNYSFRRVSNQLIFFCYNGADFYFYFDFRVFDNKVYINYLPINDTTILPIINNKTVEFKEFLARIERLLVLL